MSTPSTSWPSSAIHTAWVAPRYPVPNTVIFMCCWYASELSETRTPGGRETNIGRTTSASRVQPMLLPCTFSSFVRETSADHPRANALHVLMPPKPGSPDSPRRVPEPGRWSDTRSSQLLRGFSRGLGGDPTEFQARRMTAALASDADLILTMTESQRDKVLAMAPARLKRTFTLREAARLGSLADAGTVEDLAAARPRFRATEPEDVMDPMGKEENVFHEIGLEIADLLGPLLSRLRFGER